jgi:hypothetical protein
LRWQEARRAETAAVGETEIIESGEGRAGREGKGGELTSSTTSAAEVSREAGGGTGIGMFHERGVSSRTATARSKLFGYLELAQTNSEEMEERE